MDAVGGNVQFLPMYVYLHKHGELYTNYGAHTG